MLRIQQITNDASQQQSLVLPDGSAVLLQINFKPLQIGWFITKLVYGDFELYGVRITNSPNILYQFKNQIPFGLACFSTANREPSQQDDFSSEASKLYILTEAEVQAYSDYITNG